MTTLIRLHLTALLLTTLTGFAQTDTRLSGIFPDLHKGARVRLMQTSEEGYIDSLIVRDSTFEFNVPVSERELYIIEFFIDANRYGYPVFLQPGDPVHMQIASRFTRISFSGSAIADDQHDFYQSLHAFVNEEARLNTQLANEKDTALIRKGKAEKLKLNQQRQEQFANWIRAHNNSAYALAVMVVFMEDSPFPLLLELYHSITEEAKRDNLLTEELSFLLMTKPYDDLLKTGDKLTGFTLPDTAGKAHAFAALQGKDYIMIDCWASWGASCRKAVPALQKLAATYSKQGFKIIGISADTKAKDWKQAIVEDGTRWNQLSDLQGTLGGFLHEKGIYHFPTYILVSPDGTVLAKTHKVEGIQEVLQQVFKTSK
ncbi:AhpC/TSA family protein [Pseudoflavitalea sp. X16]|uniref:TlpA disulfide reductase family protein n=1 Tax=Paraflavitalea devenefica TaxID=2716334 RepID=UPI00142022A0|nr:TlpA disulfide reductase family protein [Paraflavitalea devenefica]NII28787.1 AhpC/TSA family protein [Paraflavitalea devenefica]